MSSVFGREYAAAYDRLYHEKDYRGECDLLERIFREFAPAPVRSVLDLGCGTGGHAIPLSLRGYRVTGLDRSEDMVRVARDKANLAGIDLPLHTADLRTARLKETFDAALMMFTVLGYQCTDEDVAAALATARSHLAAGGLLVFDVWHGPAVHAQRPEPRTREVPTAEGSLVRSARAELDEGKRLITVHYDLRETVGDRMARGAKEHHRLRYFFADELTRNLRDAGFNLRALRPFPSFEGEPDERSWNVIAVAEALKSK
jgi:SAM-dependent methyltransferase